MAKNRAIAPAARRPRFHGTVTTMIMILMTMMIVRDILVRRWSTSSSTPDVAR